MARRKCAGPAAGDGEARREINNTTPHHSEDGPTHKPRQPRRFGRDIHASFVATRMESTDSLGLLQAIDENWPNLSFADYLGARALVAAVRMETEGTA
jgi:hypothetical protein